MLARKIDEAAPGRPAGRAAAAEVHDGDHDHVRAAGRRRSMRGTTTSPRPARRLIGTTPLTACAYPLGLHADHGSTLGGRARPRRRDLELLPRSATPGRTDSTPRATCPDGMALVPGGEFAMYLPGLDHLKPEPTDGVRDGPSRGDESRVQAIPSMRAATPTRSTGSEPFSRRRAAS